MGSGLLPTHIEHTLPDVASLFKKILIGLPGGLLGSLKLFEALDDILLKLQPDSELAESDHAALKAKLVALAISSVTSAYRVYLIEAVVGLVAYFAAETEKFQAEQAAAVAEDQERPGSSKSELMGHQSLGVVLGPLLLGDLTDKIDVNGGDESLEGAPRKSSESAKRSKKQKRNSVPNKLEKDANLSAHVDRANLTATVMQQLLIVWRDVVNQLREMNGKYSSSLMQSRSTSQIKTIPTRTTSRLTLRSSEEEMQLMDFLRGRSLPGEFRGPVEVKRKVRISGRSPMSRGAFKVSEDGQIHGEGVLGACQQQANGDTDDNNVDKPAVQDSAQTFDFYASASTRRDEHDAEDSAGLSADGITHSDIAMDKMAMGTILPRLRDPSDSSVSPGRVRLVPSMSDHSEDDNSEPEDSSNEAPQTVVKIARTPNYNDEPNTTRQRPSLDTSKPLPPIGNAQRAELSSPLSGDELTQVEARGLLSSRRSSRRSMSALSARHSSPRTLFPARQGRRGSREIYSPPRQSSYPLRQDSLPTEGHLQMKSIEMDENFADYRARSNAQMSPMKNFSRKLSEAPFGSDQIFGDPKRNSVKAIAQQFAEQSRAQRNEVEATKTRELPKVYAYVHPLLTPNDQVVDLPLEDPFVSLDDAAVQERPQIQRSLSPEKESLIPRPLFDIGRGRKAESRSPSPNKMDSPSTPKRAPAKSPAKRLSIYNSVQDQNAEIIRRDTNEISKSAAKTKREAIMESMHAINTNSLSLSEGTPGPSLEVVPLRPSARRSAEPFYFRSSHRDEPPTTTTLTNRAISLARSESPTGRSVSPNRNAKRSLSHLDTITRSNSFLNASDELKKLERHGSINTALYTEICRLQRTLEQKGEEVLAVRRGVEVQRVVGKDGEGKRESWGKDGVKRESWGRDKVDDEVEKARKEIDVWRVRAERAERRLAEKDQIQRTTSGFLGSGGESKGSRDWGTSPGLPDREPDIEVIKTRDPGTDAGSLAGPRLEVSGADSRNQEMDAGSQGQTNLGVSS